MGGTIVSRIVRTHARYLSRLSAGGLVQGAQRLSYEGRATGLSHRATRASGRGGPAGRSPWRDGAIDPTLQHLVVTLPACQPLPHHGPHLGRQFGR